MYGIKPGEKANEDKDWICFHFYFLQSKLVMQAKFRQCLLRNADILDTFAWREHSP